MSKVKEVFIVIGYVGHTGRFDAHILSTDIIADGVDNRQIFKGTYEECNVFLDSVCKTTIQRKLKAVCINDGGVKGLIVGNEYVIIKQQTEWLLHVEDENMQEFIADKNLFQTSIPKVRTFVGMKSEQ